MTSPSTQLAANKPIIQTGTQVGPVDYLPMQWPDGCGAEAVFIGRTRCQIHPEHGSLLRLEYEVYGDMASKLLDQMARDAAREFTCHSVRVVHATGPVELGQGSVAIQVAAPHRAEAFDACRFIIERIKHELPIWKHEIWERGRTFVEGCCAHD